MDEIEEAMDEIVEAIHTLEAEIGGRFNEYGTIEYGTITQIENALETLGEEMSGNNSIISSNERNERLIVALENLGKKISPENSSSFSEERQEEKDEAIRNATRFKREEEDAAFDRRVQDFEMYNKLRILHPKNHIVKLFPRFKDFADAD